MTMIEVDDIAAEMIRKAQALAKARGETLGDYLAHWLPPVAANSDEARRKAQLDAWQAFVALGTEWSREHLPPGYVADDSREAMYGDPI